MGTSCSGSYFSVTTDQAFEQFIEHVNVYGLDVLVHSFVYTELQKDSLDELSEAEKQYILRECRRFVSLARAEEGGVNVKQLHS